MSRLNKNICIPSLQPKYSHQNSHNKTSVVVHICNPNILLVTWEAENGTLPDSSWVRNPKHVSKRRDPGSNMERFEFKSFSLNSNHVPLCTQTPKMIYIYTHLSISIPVYLSISQYTHTQININKLLLLKITLCS